MSLDDFLKSCKEKGQTPLRYSEDTIYTNGRRRVKWTDPAYARGMALLNEKLGFKGNNLITRLYGSEVVIRTPHGFHHGELQSYDGEFFYLKGYCFSREPMGTFEYGANSMFSKDAVVPAEGVVSVREIPMVVEKGEEEEINFRR
jgi:hypothetical protein